MFIHELENGIVMHVEKFLLLDTRLYFGCLCVAYLPRIKCS